MKNYARREELTTIDQKSEKDMVYPGIYHGLPGITYIVNPG